MGGGDQSADDHAELVRLLCEQARTLAAQLPPGLAKLSLRAGECEVSMRLAPPPSAVAAAPQPHAGAVEDVRGAVASADASDASEADEAEGTAVTAPLVGTFYRAPEPGADPFVEVGDLVEEGQVVAIIEAMKLMNRIEATAPGRVSAILVEDKEMVEHGQPLVLIAPEADETEGAADDGAGRA